MMVTVRSARYSRATVFGIVLAMVAALTLALAGGAQAKGEYEPNDTRETAHGPLLGEKDYVAEIDTENDVDWYLFYVKTYSQMEFVTTMLKSDGCSVLYRLYDKDGEQLETGTFRSGHVEKTERFHLTMNPGRYYLKVDLCAPGDRYRFRVNPAAALTSDRACGEAIVARDTATPLLTEASAELGNTAGSLAAANTAVRESKEDLAKLKRRWEKGKARWRKMKRRIKRHSESPRFQHRERRRLRRSRARLNRTLPVAKRSARSELATASETRAKVLAKRAPLQVLVTQHTNAKVQAEAQIAASC